MFVIILDSIVMCCTPDGFCCWFLLFTSQSDSSPYQRPQHSPIFMRNFEKFDKASREEIHTLAQCCKSATNSLRRKFCSTMFLRSIGSRFSIQRGSLLLRRVPVRFVTGIRQSAIEENGDTSVVGIVCHLYCSSKVKACKHCLKSLSFMFKIALPLKRFR